MIAAGIKFIINGTAEVMMQPARFKILQHLRNQKAAQYIDQIAKAVDVHPRMVSHHIDVLQEQGLVESKYELAKAKGSKRGLAVRMCVATAKAEEALHDIQESIKGGARK